MKSQSENPAGGLDHTLIPQSEVQGRIRKLQALLQETNLGGLLIVNRINLLYFSGTAQNGFLYIPGAGRPLLLIKRYLPRARREAGIPDVLEIRSTRDLPQVLAGFYGPLPASALGMEGDVLPQREFDFFRSLFPAERWSDGSPLIRRGRRVKTAWEVGCLERAADRSAETLAFAAGKLAEGVSGPSLAAAAEIFARRLGHGARIRLREDLARFCHTPAPARADGAVRWPVALGFRFVLQGYHVEETRLFAPGGLAGPLHSACGDLAEIHDFLLERLKPGLPVAELCRLAGDKARALGHGERFLQPSAAGAAILGHGVGLELVEEPLVGAQSRAVFEAGMVIALEPRLALDRELTLTLGSVCLVTPSGCRRLSRVPVGVRPC